MQQYAGRIRCVSSESGRVTSLEVRVDFDGDAPEHVYIISGRHQFGDFPYGHPTTNLEAHANKLVRDGADSIEFSEQVEPIIDWADTHKLRQEDPNAFK